MTVYAALSVGFMWTLMLPVSLLYRIDTAAMMME